MFFFSTIAYLNNWPEEKCSEIELSFITSRLLEIIVIFAVFGPMVLVSREFRWNTAI